jgi:stage V sporulation protein AA
MNKTCLYIKVNKSNLLNSKTVHLEDVAKLYSSDKNLVTKLNKSTIYHIKENKKKLYSFSVFKLFEEIDKNFPNLDIQNIGDTDFIIQYEPPKKKNKILDYAKVCFVSLIVFFGAAFTIMTFNEDVNIKDLFTLVYELVMQGEKGGGTILEISYAVGLPVGIIVFFDHFSKIKMGIDPTPMQVQVRLYEENLEKAVIENANRKGELIDSK